MSIGIVRGVQWAAYASACWSLCACDVDNASSTPRDAGPEAAVPLARAPDAAPGQGTTYDGEPSVVSPNDIDAAERGTCAPPKGPNLNQLLNEPFPQIEQLVSAAGGSSFVHGDDLYYVDANVGLVRIIAGSKTPEVVLARPTGWGLRYAHIADGSLYFAEQGTTALQRIPLADPRATPEIQRGTPHEGDVAAVRGDDLFGMDPPGKAPQRTLWKQSFTTGQVQVLAEHSASHLDVAAGYVYFTGASAGGLYRVPTEGGETEHLREDDLASGGVVRVIGDRVYWANAAKMWVTSAVAPFATEPLSEYAAAPAPSPIRPGSELRGAFEFVEYDERVYWRDYWGTLGWTSRDRVACGSIATLDWPQHILGIGQRFWFTSDGTMLYRIPL